MRMRGQRGAAAEREPDQANAAAEAERDQADQAVDAEAAAQWEAHVTAQLREQVRAELQVRLPGAPAHPCAVPCRRPWRCAARGVLLFASAGGVRDTPSSAACGRPGVCSTGQDGSLQGLSDMASDSSNSSKACVWQPSETGELLACAAGPGCEPLRTTYCPKPLAVTCDPRRRLRRRPARARPRPSGCASSCATACAPSSLRSCALACALRSPRSLRPSCALSWRRRSAHGASATLRSSCAEPASAWTASCLMMGPPVCGEVIRRQC